MEELITQQKEIVWVLGFYGLIVLAVLWYLQKTHRPDSGRQTQKRLLFLLLGFAAAGLTLRVVAAWTLPGYQADMHSFEARAARAYTVGLQHFYDEDTFASHAPLYTYYLYFVGWLQNISGADPDSDLCRFMIRLPAILADLALAWIVFRLGEKHQGRSAGLLLSCFVLLNPAVIINSAIWGQTDSLLVLMTAGIIWLLGEHRIVAASGLFMLTFLMQVQAVMIAPLLIFAYVYEIAVSRKKLQVLYRTVLSAVVMTAVWLLTALPLGLASHPAWLWDKMLDSLRLSGRVSLSALNVYALFGLNWKTAPDATFLGMDLYTWGYVFMTLICAWMVRLLCRRQQTWYLFAVSAFLIFAFYSVVPCMHERYAYPVPFLLLISYALCRDSRLLACCVLSFASVLAAEAMSLYCYPDAIPVSLLSIGSVLSLSAFGYTAYVVSALAFRNPKDRALPATEPLGPTAAMRIQERLQRPLGWQKCDRKDVWIILIICAAYSLLAFTNLGTFEIPETHAVLDEEAVIAFPEAEHITRFEYYAAYGSGKFEVLSSADGTDYIPVQLSWGDFEGSKLDHRVRDLYKWNRYTTDVEAKYIKLVPKEGALPILEIGFFGPDEQLLIPSEIMMEGEVVTAWTDEQSIVPYARTYMTDMYFDEIYHARTSYEHLHGIRPFEATHPPLGKLILAVGIQIFGMNPFGWRFMGALAGVCMLPVIYILARMIFVERKFAVFATVLLAADGMHYTQTRIGTIDSYSVLWIMAMYLFMYRYAQTNFNRQPLRETLKPLFWCGLFFGIGAATKWLCLYAGAGLLIIYVYLLIQRHQEYVYARKNRKYPELTKDYRHKLTATLLWSVLFFILIPAAIYLASYTPHMLVTEGKAYTFSDILENQNYMLNYHANLDPEHAHPFRSKWYTWPVDMRPVMFFTSPADGTIATMSTMGNPLVWWLGIVAMVSLPLWAVRSRKLRTFRLFFLMTGLLAEYVPWWFISREVFIYHYFAVLPFLILFIVAWLMELEERYRWGRTFGYWVIGACVGIFAAFYPVFTGLRVPAAYIKAIRWFPSWPFY